jgi:PAS domain S-box-containing protein
MSRNVAEVDLRRLLDALPEAVVAIDGVGRVLYASGAVARWLGWSGDELIGQNLDATIKPRARAPRSGSAATPRRGRQLARRRDGVDVELEVETMPAPVGLEPVAELLVLRPPRREPDTPSLSVMTLAKEPFSILEALPDGLILIEGHDERVRWLNGAAMQMLGLDAPPSSLEDLAARAPMERIERRSGLDGVAPLAQLVRRGEPARTTLRLRRGDGGDMIVDLAAAPWPQPGQGTVLLIRDVTTRHRQETDLNVRALQLKTLLDHLPVGVVYFDHRAQCRASNGPARMVFGRAAQEIFGAPADELFARAPALLDALLRSIIGRTSFVQTSVPWVEGASTRFLDWRFEPLGAPDASRATGALALMVDATERTQAALALQHAASAAEADSRRKSQFLTAISHDLRNPVNALSLQTELLARLLARRKEPEGDVRSLVGDIHRVVTNLIELLNDLLDLSRFEAGAIEDRPSIFALEEWLESALAPLEGAAVAKGLDFTWRVDRPGRVIRADRTNLGRVLTNLVGNALKFTERGGVDVSVRATPDRGLILVVRDTGPGIPADQLERIFDEFAQLRNPARDPSKGTGLGLAICRRLVEGVGGRLTVESRVGEGSTFTARYPPQYVAVQQPEPVPEAPARSAAPADPDAPLLLVEDDYSSRTTLAQLLEQAGYTVATASNGQEALELMARSGPALVLLDMVLPGMDGADVLRSIRANPAWHAVPVVLLTGDPMTGRTEDLMALNVDGLLMKPVDLDQLLGTVGRILQHAQAPV